MTIFGKHFVDKLSSPAPAHFKNITHTMSTPQQQQPSRAEQVQQGPVAAPRRPLAPVPAPRRNPGLLKKLVLCSAPCCVKARCGECPLDPVPQQAPVPAPRAAQVPGRLQERGGEPDPAPTDLGRHLCQERRRKRREEERRKKEVERMMIDSDSSSEEDIC